MKGEKQIALDRYDPTQGSLKRVELGVDLPSNGTLAAGRDALYVAAPKGNQGRWRVSWDPLD